MRDARQQRWRLRRPPWLADWPVRRGKPVAIDLRGWVTPEDLNVAPALLGLPLATPRQRLLAIGIDLLLLALLARLANFWLLAAPSLALWLQIRARRSGRSWRQAWLGWTLAAALGGLGLVQAWHEFGADVRRVPVPPQAGAPADIAEAAAVVAAVAPGASDALRIAALEAEVERLRSARFNVREQVQAWADELGLGLGWAIAYFSLLPVLWPGQTVGKRLLGLRVVELTGKPLTLMHCLKRYGGYAAGLSTGMLGFAQILWDPNRQAIQDKTAHTVVIDARRDDRLAIDAPGPLPAARTGA